MELLTYGDLTLDVEVCEVIGPGGRAVLSPKLMLLLELLVRARGRVVTNEHLLDSLWRGASNGPMPATVRVHIYRLRRLLRPLRSQLEILSRRDVGYCLK